MNEIIPTEVVKPKRQLTDAQRAALKKGREALAEKRRVALQNTLVNETQTNNAYEFEPRNPDTLQNVCSAVVILLASYFMMFIVCQQL